jgi:hypothetical protein
MANLRTLTENRIAVLNCLSGDRYFLYVADGKYRLDRYTTGYGTEHVSPYGLTLKELFVYVNELLIFEYKYAYNAPNTYCVHRG